MLRAAVARGLCPAQPASLPSPPPQAPSPSLAASTITGSASSSSAATTSSSSSNGGGGSISNLQGHGIALNCVRGNPPHTTVHDGPRSALRPAPSLVHFLRTPFLSSPLARGLPSPSVTAVAAAAGAARAHHRLLSRSSRGRSATITAFRDDDWDPTKEGGAFPSSLPVRRSGGSGGGGGGHDPSWPYSGLPGSPSGPWSINAQQKQEQKQPAAGGGGGPGRGRGGDDDGRGGWGGGGGGGDGGSEGGPGWNLPFAATAVMLLLPFLSQFFLAVHICYCFLLLMESGKERLAAASAAAASKSSNSSSNPTTSSNSAVTEQLPPIAVADPASTSFTSSSGIGVIGTTSLKSGGGGGRDEVGRRLSLQPAVPIFMMLLSSALRLCGSLQPCPEAYAYGLASAVGLTVWAGGRCLAFRELTPSGLMSAFSASMAAIYSTALYHATP